MGQQHFTNTCSFISGVLLVFCYYLKKIILGEEIHNNTQQQAKESSIRSAENSRNDEENNIEKVEPNSVTILGNDIEKVVEEEKEIIIYDLKEIKKLPEEIIEQILFFLDHRTLMRMRMSCRSFLKKIDYRKNIEAERCWNYFKSIDELHFCEKLRISDMASVVGLHVHVLACQVTSNESNSWGEIGFAADQKTLEETSPRIRIFTGRPTKVSNEDYFSNNYSNYEKYNKFVYRGDIKEFESFSTLPGYPYIGVWTRSRFSEKIDMARVIVNVVSLNHHLSTF